MGKRQLSEKQKEARKRRRKSSVVRTPVAVETCKELFLKQLALGRTPGEAANKVKATRAVFYKWRKEDEAFAAMWDEAVEAGLDKLEDAIYQDGLKYRNENARYLLSRKRFDRLNAQLPVAQTIINVTLQEHVRRIVDVGLPQPQIENDLDILDVAADTP